MQLVPLPNPILIWVDDDDSAVTQTLIQTGDVFPTIVRVEESETTNEARIIET
jgi:hypothetical protein